MDGARNAGNSHFINRLTACVKQRKTQVILEVRDDDLDAVLKWHSDVWNSYTLLDLQEPHPDHLSCCARSCCATPRH
jgi:ATP-dependent Clp protease ATP-binding subunit ClpB